MVTASSPEVEVLVVQDAEQEVAFAEDQVSVDVLFNKTDVGSAVKLTVGSGSGSGCPLLFPPPPPPPPHEAINKILKMMDDNFLISSI